MTRSKVKTTGPDRTATLARTRPRRPERAVTAPGDDTSATNPYDRSSIGVSQRLDHLLASSPTTIYANEAAGDHRCTYVSANLCTLTGYEPRQMRADPRFWFERVHPEDRARVLAHCSDPAKLRDGVLLYRFRRADDTYIWIHDRHRLIYDATGQVVEPIVALSGKGLLGVEALVRWQAPDEGLVSPGEFIPLAEETGLIVSLGERVLELACAQMVRWRDLGLPQFPVSVNLARGQLTPNLPAFLAGLIDRHGLPGARLTLELTESALMEPTAGLCQMLNDIKALGMSLAIDDFGTGYSSLSYLAYLPVNTPGPVRPAGARRMRRPRPPICVTTG